MSHFVINNALSRSNSRHRCIVLLVSLAVIVLVLTFGALPDINLFWREVQNSGHTLLFILISILVLLLLHETSHSFFRKPFKIYITACFISLLTGVAIELIQLLTHGDASETDVLRDLAGTLVGLGLYASADPEMRINSLTSAKGIKIGIITLSICIFSASMLPLAFLASAYVQRESTFPVIVDLTSNWTQPFLRLKNATITLPIIEKTRTDGADYLTRINFKNGIYPGVSMIETFPDWSAYNALTLSVYSKLARSFTLTLRIHDDQHNYAYADRFNRKLAINKGINYFRILLEDVKNAPVNREMNMTQIREIILFSAQNVEGLHFYLDKIRLE